MPWSLPRNVIGSDDANAGNDGSGGSNGGDGNDGASGLDSSLTDCTHSIGGGGGSNSCGGMNVQGGNGAAANCPYAYLSGSTVIGDDEPYGSDGPVRRLALVDSEPVTIPCSVGTVVARACSIRAVRVLARLEQTVETAHRAVAVQALQILAIWLACSG